MVLQSWTIKSFTHIATKSIPIVSYFLNLLAKSILVPTPSVHETITGSLILRLLMSNNEPNPPIISFVMALSFFCHFSWIFSIYVLLTY